MKAAVASTLTALFVFELIGVGMLALMLKTGKARYFGVRVSRAEQPKQFGAVIRGLTLAMILALVFFLVPMIRNA